MRRPLIVLVAHGLDLVTFMAVLGLGMHISGEFNSFVTTAYMAGGLGLIIVLKAAQAIALACLVAWKRYEWFSRVAFVPAAGMGLLGALSNGIASTYV